MVNRNRFGKRFVRSLGVKRQMERTCHVITDLRASSVPGMFELYCRGSIFRLALRGGAVPDLSAMSTRGPLLVLLGTSLDGSMDELRDVLGKTPQLGGLPVVVHGTATGWQLDLGAHSHVRMQPAEVHPLRQGSCTFWITESVARGAGGRPRPGWYAGELLEAIRHPDGVEGDLQAVLHRLVTADDPWEALGVDRAAGHAALNGAYMRLMAAHQPARISPAESERRLELHRRIRDAALRVFGLAEAA